MSKHFDRGSFFYGEAYLLHGGQAIVPPPSLRLPEAVFRELAYYFSMLSQEMQVMGFVEKTRKNEFLLMELAVPPQRAGFAHADLDQNAFVAWLDALEADGKDVTKLRFQGHSHGVMDAYFSSTDVATIREAYSANWMVSLVGNQAGSFLARLDVFEPVPVSIGLPIVIESPRFAHSAEEAASWQKKFAISGLTTALRRGA